MIAASIEPVKRLEVKQAAELAQFYHIPPSLMNAFVVQFGDTVYPKEAFYLHAGHQKGIQRIVVQEPYQENGEWRTKASIYPRISAETIRAVANLPDEDRKRFLDYLTAPTEEWGRASTSNVRMASMHLWLPELAIKRAICRALRLFVGIGATAYEELPEAVVESKDLQEAKTRFVHQEESEQSPSTLVAKPPQHASAASPKPETQPTTWTDQT